MARVPARPASGPNPPPGNTMEPEAANVTPFRLLGDHLAGVHVDMVRESRSGADRYPGAIELTHLFCCFCGLFCGLFRLLLLGRELGFVGLRFLHLTLGHLVASILGDGIFRLHGRLVAGS